MNFAKVRSSFEAAVKQAGLLGTLFWWDLGNNRVVHKRLVERADAAGLDRALLPPAVRATTAFRRAWRAAARRIGDDLLLREIADTPDKIVVAVVLEDHEVPNLDLRYQMLARATFSKKSEAIAVLEQQRILDGLGALFEHYSAVTTEDVRAMVLAFVRRSGLSIRNAAGVHFIPPTLSETLRALARDTLDAEIAAVEVELAAFDARNVETRDSALQRRLKKFDELRGRTNLMAGALSFRADALHDKLAALEGEVKRQLVGDQPDLASASVAAPGSTGERARAFDAEVGF